MFFYALETFGCQESVSILPHLAKAAVCSLLLLCICSYLDQETWIVCGSCGNAGR
jgi:hypothetical protein